MAFYGCGPLRLDFTDAVREQLQFEMDPDEEYAGQAAELIKEMAAKAKRFYKEGFQGNPFVIESPDLNALAWPADFSTVAEVGERTVSQILRAYEGKLGYDESVGFRWLTSDTMQEGVFSGSSTETVKLYHLETEQFTYDVLEHGGREGMLLELRPVLIGRPWYTFTAGKLTSSNEPRHAFQPLIGPIYPVCQKLEVTGTLINSGALNTGRNMWQLVDNGRGPQNFIDVLNKQDTDWNTISFDPTQQMLSTPPDGKHWEPVLIPEQGQLIRAHELLLQELGEKGFPSVLMPDTSIDVKSGYDRARQMEAATAFITPPLRNLAAAWQELFLQVSEICRTLDVPITITTRPRAQGENLKMQETITIQPEDFREQDLEVSFESIPATVLHAMRESDMRMLQGGTMSRRTFMANHYDDPLEEEEEMKRERMTAFLDGLAEQDVQAVIQVVRGQYTMAAAADAGVPTEALAEMAGVGGRPERPPEGSASPGLGAPLVPGEQPQPAGSVPPDVGTEQIGTVQ